jgi:hypothetical protein
MTFYLHSIGITSAIAEKRASAQKAEVDFFSLLQEQNIKEGSVWKDVRHIGVYSCFLTYVI